MRITHTLCLALLIYSSLVSCAVGLEVNANKPKKPGFKKRASEPGAKPTFQVKEAGSKAPVPPGPPKETQKVVSEGGPVVDCKGAIDAWIETQSELKAMSNKIEGIDRRLLENDELLYFLHVPRTGGRVLNECLLKPATRPSRRCPKAYDHLERAGGRPADCHLLSTHNDYNILDILPERTATITNIRDPVDRVISAYEFAATVAVRQLSPNATKNAKPDKMSTMDIWPWSILVPIMREDMIERRTKLTEAGKRPPPVGNPYDSPDLLMPLKDFISHPSVIDVVHNGATLQLLGITTQANASLGQTAEPDRVQQLESVRACASKGGKPALALGELAQKRLKQFRFVGVTEKYEETVKVASRMLGFDLRGTAYKNPKQKTPTPAEEADTALYGDVDVSDEEQATADVVAPQLKDLTMKEWKHLMDNEKSRLRRAQAAQRKVGLSQYSSQAEQQADMERLKAELANAEQGVKNAEARKPGAPGAPPPVKPPEPVKKQLSPEEEDARLAWNMTLAANFYRCFDRHNNRTDERNARSWQNMVWEDGTPLKFGRAMRAKIPMQLVSMIRAANAADVSIHSFAGRLLANDIKTIGASNLESLESIAGINRAKRAEETPTGDGQGNGQQEGAGAGEGAAGAGEGKAGEAGQEAKEEAIETVIATGFGKKGPKVDMKKVQEERRKRLAEEKLQAVARHREQLTQSLQQKAAPPETINTPVHLDKNRGPRGPDRRSNTWRDEL